MNPGTTITQTEDPAIGDRKYETGGTGNNIGLLAPSTLGASWHCSHDSRPALASTRRHLWQLELPGKFIRLLGRGYPDPDRPVWRKQKPARRDHVGMSSPDADHDTPIAFEEGNYRAWPPAQRGDDHPIRTGHQISIPSSSRL